VKLGTGLLARLETAGSAAFSTSSFSSSSSPPSSFRRVAASEMLRARLASFLGKESKYHGLLIKDRNQAVFKDTVLQNMETSSFYFLVNYWVKLGIVKSGGAACCEGDFVGISAHGLIFMYKNLTKAELEAISLQNEGVDWSEFPKPPDEGRGAYCEGHAAAYCNDAKQDQFHIKSVMKAAVASFVKEALSDSDKKSKTAMSLERNQVAKRRRHGRRGDGRWGGVPCGAVAASMCPAGSS